MDVDGEPVTVQRQRLPVNQRVAIRPIGDRLWIVADVDATATDIVNAVRYYHASRAADMPGA